MKKLIVFKKLDPLGTAKRVDFQDIITMHGNVVARDIMDGAHPIYKALYADIFIEKLRVLFKELKE